MKQYPWTSGLKSTSDFDAKPFRRIVKALRLDALLSGHRNKKYILFLAGAEKSKVDYRV